MSRYLHVATGVAQHLPKSRYEISLRTLRTKDVVGDNPVPAPLCPTEMSHKLPQSQSHINLNNDSRIVTCKQTNLCTEGWAKRIFVTCHWVRAKEVSLLFLHLVHGPSGGTQLEGI
jgi:hypothetical protein